MLTFSATKWKFLLLLVYIYSHSLDLAVQDFTKDWQVTKASQHLGPFRSLHCLLPHHYHQGNFQSFERRDKELLWVPCTSSSRRCRFSISSMRRPHSCCRSVGLCGMVSAAAVGDNVLAPLEDAVDVKMLSMRGWCCRISFWRVWLFFIVLRFGQS